MSQKFFEIIPPGTNIDFIGKWRYVFTISILMVVVSTVLLFTKGINYGVDFKGGTDLHIRFYDKTSAAEVRTTLSTLGYGDAMVQGYGDRSSNEFLIRVQPEALNLIGYKERLQPALNAVAPAGGGAAKIRFQEDRIYVSYDQPSEPKRIEEAVNGVGGRDLRVDNVAQFGTATANEYLVQFAGIATKVTKAFRERLGPAKFEVLQVEQVGAKVGSELRMQAIGAVLISILLIGIYVWFRFDMIFAPGAMISLIHDPLAVLLVFAVFGIQFDLSIVAAILTLIGFSINDTIVVYDRIRENLKKTKDVDLPSLMNRSINECLGRTILTTGTVFMAALALLFLGGPITFNFALAFAIGLIVGTYSTIYVCCPITIMINNYMARRAALR
ncbi:MAG: protein translocase subunit SecF [Pseudomonadota bacterium]